jgi:hypothetical protein
VPRNFSHDLYVDLPGWEGATVQTSRPRRGLRSVSAVAGGSSDFTLYDLGIWK